MAFTRDKMNWHPAWNDGPPEGQPERAPTQDENFGSWGQFAAQGGLAQVPAPHPAHPQPPPQQWPGFNVPSKLRTSKKKTNCNSVFLYFLF
jgi:hypothetical protein